MTDTTSLWRLLNDAANAINTLSLYSWGYLQTNESGGDPEDQAYLAAVQLKQAANLVYAEIRNLEERLDGSRSDGQPHLSVDPAGDQPAYLRSNNGPAH